MPGLKVHDFRHPAASMAIVMCADVRAVQSDAVSREGGDDVGRIRGALNGRLDAAAERLDAAASLARADSLRTAEVLRLCPRAEAKGSQASDLRNCGVSRLARSDDLRIRYT
jgi:hypothetical protein